MEGFSHTPPRSLFKLWVVPEFFVPQRATFSAASPLPFPEGVSMETETSQL